MLKFEDYPPPPTSHEKGQNVLVRLTNATKITNFVCVSQYSVLHNAPKNKGSHNNAVAIFLLSTHTEQVRQASHSIPLADSAGDFLRGDSVRADVHLSPHTLVQESNGGNFEKDTCR